MSWLVTRILLTMLLLPSAAMLQFIAFIFLERELDDGRAIFVAVLLTGAFVVAYWLALWRKTVVWTPRRVRDTWWCGAGAILAGAAMAAAIRWVFSYSYGLDSFTGGNLAIVLWMIGTVCIWRETADERAARLTRAGTEGLVCPACGYNLTGLREPRCPECGAQYTLDELYAAQPGRAPVEIEKG